MDKSLLVLGIVAVALVVIMAIDSSLPLLVVAVAALVWVTRDPIGAANAVHQGLDTLHTDMGGVGRKLTTVVQDLLR